VLRLARGAMAQLAVQRLPPTQLVLDLAAVAVGLILDVEVRAIVVDLVRGARLPLADASRRLAAGLIFIHSFVVVVCVVGAEGGGAEGGACCEGQSRARECR
jgi:hypothetical protein